MKFELSIEYPTIPDSWYLLGEYANKLGTIKKDLMHIRSTSNTKEVISTIDLITTISTRAQDIALNIFSHIGVRRCENKRCCHVWYMNLRNIENLFHVYIKDLENM